MHFHLPKLFFNPLSLSLSPPQSPSTPIHKIRSILESPFQPTHQPLPITFKTDFLPPDFLSTPELINPVKLARSGPKISGRLPSPS